MKAAVCYEFGKPLVVEEIEIDPPQIGEVKVRMVATAICHSDVHLIRGEWGGELPVVAGHEGAGIVEEVGPGVSLVHQGDHVVVSLLRSCGRCESCMTGIPHLCGGEFALQSESRLRNRQGQLILHGLRTAAFAEYVIVDQSQLAPVPKEMSLESASLLACGVITGLGAVGNTQAQVYVIRLCMAFYQCNPFLTTQVIDDLPKPLANSSIQFLSTIFRTPNYMVLAFPLNM